MWVIGKECGACGEGEEVLAPCWLAAASACSPPAAPSLDPPSPALLPLPACSPILLFQFAYKAIFFFKSTLPALQRNKPADKPAIKMGG